MAKQSTATIKLPIGKRYFALFIGGEEVPKEQLRITVNGKVTFEGEEFKKRNGTHKTSNC